MAVIDRFDCIDKSDLTELFDFIFENQIFYQIDGVLTDLFMEYYEGKWIDTYKKSKLSLYKRFIGDIFCFFQSEEEAMEFGEYLNTKHLNIKFTFENKVLGKWPFLDVTKDIYLMYFYWIINIVYLLCSTIILIGFR